MMGRKSNYFRHTLNAHNDPKIMSLISRKNGLVGVGFFWILVELYGSAFVNDDEQKEWQVMHIRTIANATGLRSDSTRTWIKVGTELELIDTLWDNFGPTSVQLRIPNFSKYFGYYKKTEAKKCPNKRKRKEKKEKEIKSIQKNSSLSLLPDAPKFMGEFIEQCDYTRLENFIEDYGQDTALTFLERIIDYSNSTGKKYKCYVSTMRNWCRKDGVRKKGELSAFEKLILKHEQEALATPSVLSDGADHV